VRQIIEGAARRSRFQKANSLGLEKEAHDGEVAGLEQSEGDVPNPTKGTP
jgi:hypothetical protein